MFTIDNVYNALGLTGDNRTQSLINAIRNSTEFKGMTQLYDGSVEGLNQFGIAVNRSQRHQNIFLNELVDRIGKVVITKTTLMNPLKKFKKGQMTTGKSVEEIFNDLLKAQSFNPEDASETLFKRNPPNTKVIFHSNWRKELYTDTIERTTILEAFTSIEKFEEFVTNTYTALYNSNEVDEYLWTKGIIESYVGNGLATYVSVPKVTDADTAREFVKKTRATSTKMTLVQGSRDFNASGVHTTTPKSRLWIMIDADLDAELDVEVLARAFNMNKTDVENQKIVVEGFSNTGLQAVLFDEDILKIYDKEFLTNSVQNEKGLYWNIFLHVHQLYSMGKFHNFVAFMYDNIPPITKLVLSPMAKYGRVNAETTFDGWGQFTEGKTFSDFDVTAELVNDNGDKVTGATATVKVNTKQKDQLTVAVKVTDKKLFDSNITVRLSVTEKGVAEGIEPFSRVVNALMVVLPE